jgi:zinc protease
MSRRIDPTPRLGDGLPSDVASPALTPVASPQANPSVAAHTETPPRRLWLRSTLGLAMSSAGAALSWTDAEAATPGVDAPPEPGPVREMELPKIAEFKLANGLTVIVVGTAVQGRPLPLVSASLMLHSGSVADPADRAGLADLTANLLTKGALRGGKPVDASTLARQAEALGGGLSASAGVESLALGMTVMPAKLEAALALMSDVLRHPLLQPAELDRARTQTVDGLRVSLSDPASLASRVARKAWWGVSPFGAVTTPASLQRIAITDVTGFHQRWARPDRAALVLAGDIDPAAARRLAEKHLGDWKLPAEAAPDLPGAPPSTVASQLVIVDLPGAGQSGVCLLAPFVSDASADRRIGQIANVVLGGGYSARLNQEVRVKRGLAYGAGSSAEAQRSGGMLMARAQTGNANASQVAQLLRDTVLAMAAAVPAPDELAARQSNLVGAFGRRFDTTDGLVAVVAERWARGRPLSEIQTYTRELLAVSGGAVREFARQHWGDATQMRLVIVGDLTKIGDGYKQLAAAPLMLRAADLDLDQPLKAM